MIYIINYDKKEAEKIKEILIEDSVEFNMGNNEVDALKSDKIILPDTKTPQKALKKLHLFNLFSALRICEKPILGIGGGFALMCMEFNGQNALGFINCRVEESPEGFETINIENNQKITAVEIIRNRYWGVPCPTQNETKKILEKFVSL